MPPDLETVRANLRKKTVYLADSGKNVLNNLVWYKTEKFDRVVARGAANAYEADYTVYSQSQSQGASSSTAPVEAPPAPPAATLSAIVRLSNYRFFLTACSDWKPGVTDNVLPLEGARPSALAEDPGLPMIAEDFRAAWDALNELTKDMVPDETELSQATGPIDQLKALYSGFKVAHKVFERKGTNTESEISDAAFSIENWPLTYPDAQEHLDKLKATHIVNPIPAYGLNGHLIRPHQYKAELKGALVRLEFHLNHRVIKGRHKVTADITRIRVLAPPPPFDTPTPKRKRLATVDDFYDEDEDEAPPTPSKRAKKDKVRGNAIKDTAYALLSRIRKT